MTTDPLDILVVHREHRRGVSHPPAQRPRERFGWLPEAEQAALVALCCDDLDPIDVQRHAETLGDALDEAHAVIEHLSSTKQVVVIEQRECEPKDEGKSR